MTKTAADYLREAATVIEERGKLRDTPEGERSMERAVKAYIALNGPTLDSELSGWLFLCVLKLARATAGKPHEDDYADLAGYAALAAECMTKGEAALDPQPVGVVPTSFWVTWEGGENPVPGKMVVAKLRCGDFAFDNTEGVASEICWWKRRGDEGCHHNPEEQEIIAYRVVG